MKKLVIILGFCTYGFFLNAQGIIRYVTPNGNPATEGNDTNAISWTAACNDLQAVINASDSGDQVWVGTGTYMPIRPANNLLVVDSFNRNNAFVLKNGVALYGGFDGVETSIEERTLAVNGIGSNGKTILSASLGAINTAYHVVIAVASTSGGRMLLDGFTISDGKAEGFGNILINGQNIDQSAGGGIYALAGKTTFSNNTILNNYASLYAGGVYTISYMNDTITFLNNRIFNNSSTFVGGGIFLNAYTGDIILLKNEINQNKLSTTNSRGGGIYAYPTRNITLEYNIIAENLASMGGGCYINMTSEGGTFNIQHCKIINNTTDDGGGIYLHADTCPLGNVNIMHTLISGNMAKNGGGIYTMAVNGGSVFLDNDTITHNTARNEGGGIYANVNEDTYQLKIINNLIDSNTANQGGGIYATGGTIKVTRNTISHNIASGISGGGIFMSSAGETTLYVDTNKFIANEASVGGGIYASAQLQGTLFIENNVFENNTVSDAGGGIYASATGGTIDINRNEINGNSSGIEGGGIYAYANGQNNPNGLLIINENSVTDNVADGGGGIYIAAQGQNNSFSNLINNLIMNNTALNNGGGVFGFFKNTASASFTNNLIIYNMADTMGGGIFVVREDAGNFTIDNNCIAKNKSYAGGGISICFQKNTQPKVTLRNNTIAYNSSTAYGGGIFAFGIGNIFAANTIVYKNDTNGIPNSIYLNRTNTPSLDLSHCLLEETELPADVTGTGNIFGENPLFVDADNDRYQLQDSSPVIDMGCNDSISTELIIDLEGNPRIQGGIVDMGAYEAGYQPLSNTTLLTLTVSEGTLSPAFDAGRMNYRVNVPMEISSIDIGATTRNTSASISGLGTKNLNVGDNRFDIIVTSENQIKMRTYSIIVNRGSTGIKDLEIYKVNIFPNPTSGIITIDNPDNMPVDIKVYSIEGTLLIETYGTQVDLSSLANGMYLLQIGKRIIKVIKN